MPDLRPLSYGTHPHVEVTCTLQEPSHLKLYRVHGVEIVIIRKLLSKTVLDLNMSKINWPGVRLQKFESAAAKSG